MLFDWSFWQRPAQKAPLKTAAGLDWVNWIALAGRGFGKTRIGAEQIRVWASEVPITHLVGPTKADVRDVMIEGPSGVMTICPKGERPIYQPSKNRLLWPNGGLSLLFSADEPERLRGPQCYKAWADELAAWRYLEEAWDQFCFGLRLGDHPQVVITTTPKPVKIIRQLIADPSTVITRGSTYDNRANLADAFFHKIITKYEGTRLGRQELMAEVLDDNPDALWKRKTIDDTRLKPTQVPQLLRIVLGVDPAVTSGEDSCDTGIVGAAMDTQDPPHFYVLSDDSMHDHPNVWARKVVEVCHQLPADRIVGEVNNGGDLIEAVIHHVDPNVPYTCVRATRGKLLRAEPIAALYEQGRVHHIGFFGALEDQMCDYTPQSKESPDRLDALVWALTELSQETEHEDLVVVGEDIHISSDLDEMEMRF